MRIRKKYFYFFSGIFILGLALFVSVYVRSVLRQTNWPEDRNVVGFATDEFKYFSKLDGRGVKDVEEEAPRIVGVMIDNHPEAWPQRGLSQARVVYEAPVEGGITRFLAIFDNAQMVEKVGPVRSARPYFIDWLKEYGDGLYMHCGGSPAALALLGNADIFSANEYYKGSYYWRDEARQAPHNLYTDSEEWQKFILKYGADRSARDWEGWKFKRDIKNIEEIKDIEGDSVKRVKIKYRPEYDVEWVYNLESNRYERWQNGQKMLDADMPVTAENVLIQSAAVEILDDIGRRGIETVGEGEARVLLLGKLIRGSWRREDLNSRTRFYDKDGKEIELIPGQTWVEVVPRNMEIEIGN